jgi:hypothetical protein
MGKKDVTVRVQISPEMNRWNIYASKLVELARKLHNTIDIRSLREEEIANAKIIF